tara:strand:+ start:1047 stop:1931 length:885 start_codon:yes stop_codon:yes gene_type:complete
LIVYTTITIIVNPVALLILWNDLANAAPPLTGLTDLLAHFANTFALCPIYTTVTNLLEGIICSLQVIDLPITIIVGPIADLIARVNPARTKRPLAVFTCLLTRFTGTFIYTTGLCLSIFAAIFDLFIDSSVTVVVFLITDLRLWFNAALTSRPITTNTSLLSLLTGTSLNPTQTKCTNQTATWCFISRPIAVIINVVATHLFDARVNIWVIVVAVGAFGVTISIVVQVTRDTLSLVTSLSTATIDVCLTDPTTTTRKRKSQNKQETDDLHQSERTNPHHTFPHCDQRTKTYILQ